MQKVKAYIMATKTHKTDLIDSDLDYFLDFDVAVLGKPPQGNNSKLFHIGLNSNRIFGLFSANSSGVYPYFR